MAKRRASGESPQSSNRLLAALPADDYRRLLPHLKHTSLPLKRILYKPGDVVDDVYLPGGGFVSVVAVLANGDMVEVATIGREGIVGVSAMIAGYREPALTMVQMETDQCVRMPAAAFRRELDRRGAFFDLITRFTQGLIGTSMQSTACNAVHRIEHRLARWLLTAHDRVGADHFPLTQEFVAMMLGAARPTVTIVAGTLQRAGLITYKRGQVVIVNRKALEQASCECYRATTALLDRVSGAAPRARA
ncbi:MAG: cyclic nucleotide-binding protein [Acidobacteria bacterium]|nr:cyclic nucleotide-binding protein [Acidobacteriota bacterium]